MRLQKHQIITIAYFFVLAVLGNGFIYHHFGNKKVSLVLFAASLLAVFFHTQKAKNRKNYLKENLGISDRPRIVAYDYLRLLAILFVISMHSIQADMEAGILQGGTAENYIFTVVYILEAVCNITYIMLSGALLLPYRDESLSKYYLKRIPKIVIPMVVYYFFYLWENGRLVEFSIAEVKEIGVCFLNGYTPECPHYWLVFVILGLYLAYPFLRYMIKDIPYRMLSGLVILIIFFMAVDTWLPYIGIQSSVTTFWSDWIGMAVIGYWVSQKETRKYDNAILALGALAVVAVAVIIKTSEYFQNIICNCSPIMAVLGMALFVLAFKTKRQRTGVVLACISKYSFGIILIHWGVLHWIVRAGLNIHVTSFRYFGSIIVVVATVVLSFVIAYLMDNLLVEPARVCWDKILSRFPFSGKTRIWLHPFQKK